MNCYNEIKNELINNEVYKRVKDYSKNRNELSTYYNVGKLLIEAQGDENRAKYEESLINEYSNKLITEVGKKYNYKTLLKMRKFYLMFKNFSTLSRHLTGAIIVNYYLLKILFVMIKRCSTATPIALSYDLILFVIRKIAPLVH